jgi:hypothetical protein
MLNLSISAHREPFSPGVALLLYTPPAIETRAAAVTHMTLTEIENDSLAVEPSCRLDQTQAQRLMDELWQCGLRPSEGSGSAGSLAATERHLEDMRRLVFEPAILKREFS